MMHITEPDVENYNSDSNDDIHILDSHLTKGQQTLFPTQKMHQFLSSSAINKRDK